MDLQTWLGPEAVLTRLAWLVPLILSLSVHEWAHAWVAFRLGDDTAYRMGRMTLDPLAHVDPVGTFALPLLGVPFGWAKPVPISPIRFRQSVDMRTGVLLTAGAGPLSNLVLAATCAGLLAGAGALAPGALDKVGAVRTLLESGVMINVVLALFNLLPVPPLDGSRVLEGLLAARWPRLTTAVRGGGVALIVLLLVVPEMLGAGPISWIARWISAALP
jgi:Zn-dependent protease